MVVTHHRPRRFGRPPKRRFPQRLRRRPLPTNQTAAVTVDRAVAEVAAMASAVAVTTRQTAVADATNAATAPTARKPMTVQSRRPVKPRATKIANGPKRASHGGTVAVKVVAKAAVNLVLTAGANLAVKAALRAAVANGAVGHAPSANPAAQRRWQKLPLKRPWPRKPLWTPSRAAQGQRLVTTRKANKARAAGAAVVAVADVIVKKRATLARTDRRLRMRTTLLVPTLAQTWRLKPRS